jgi:4-oxalomesaconate tautomerase
VVPSGVDKTVSVEHPSGQMEIRLTMKDGVPQNASFLRTARKLFDGVVFG